jgi:Zn-dependent peptidase ImmA (M78 family)
MSKQRVWRSAVSLVLSTKLRGVTPPEAAARLAADLRVKLKARGAIDLDRVCEALDLRVQYKPLGNDALLHETESGFAATINSAAPKARQRFSIAHEIGHLEIYAATRLAAAFGHPSAPGENNGEATEIEDLCNSFGTELLMPLEEWRRELFTQGISIAVIRRLMSRYKVSMQAAARRAVETEIWKCAFIMWALVVEGEKLVALRPVDFATNISTGGSNWPQTIANDPRLSIPGSPLLAVEKATETVGEIPLPFDGMEGRYLAQSAVAWGTPPRVATLILAEASGRNILMRASKGLKRG